MCVYWRDMKQVPSLRTVYETVITSLTKKESVKEGKGLDLGVEPLRIKLCCKGS